MSEVQDVVQIIRVTIDGLEIGVKVTGASLSTVKTTVGFLAALLMKEKSLGRTNVKKLLQRGGDIQVFQFPANDIRKVEKLAKKYGVLYSVMPDINQKDGMMEVLFHSEAVPRVNMMIHKLKEGKITSFEEYLTNGESDEIEKVLKPVKEEIEQTPIQTEKAEQKNFVTRLEESHISKDKEMMEVCILRHQVREETESKLKVKIPFEDKYVWVPKEKVFQSDDKRSFSVYLEKNSIYDMYSRDNLLINRMTGKQLSETYMGEKNEKMKVILKQVEKRISVGTSKAR